MDIKYKKGSLILFSGLPGSGKSTFGEKYFNGDKKNYVLSSDKMREDFFGGVYDYDENGNIVNSNNNEGNGAIFESMKLFAKQRCDMGLTTIIDAMNLDDNSRNEFIKLGKWSEIYTIIFDKTLEELINNNKKRRDDGGRYVHQYVIERKFEEFNKSTSIKNNQIINSNDIENLIENNNELLLENDMNLIVIGDSHGIENFVEYFESILKENEGKNYKIIIAGDIVDRGPKSTENLLYLYEKSKENKNIKFILGNHENKVLRLLRNFDKNNILEETTTATYKTIYDLLDICNFGYKGNIEILKDKRFNVKQIIHFLESFDDFYLIKRIDSYKTKFLISHGPFLPPKNLGNIIKGDCVYGMSNFRAISDGKIDINFLKALQKYSNSNNIVFINGHFDYSNILNDFYNEQHLNGKEIINKFTYPIEGRVDAGGNMIVLKIDSNGGINETKLDSGLNYMQTRKRLNNKDLFDKLSKEKVIVGNNSHPQYENLYIYKYGREVFYDHLWGSYDKKTNKVLELSRGIVLDTYGNLISFPFDKIFNYGEVVGNNDNKLIKGEYEFIEKCNGFLGVISLDPYNNQNLIIHTQGSLDYNGNVYIKYIKELLSKEQEINLIKFLNQKGKHTLMFEVIHPSDPHIVKYEEKDFGLKLIGCRDISSNDINKTKLFSENELNILGKELGFERPYHFISNIENVLQDLGKHKNLEGFMVRNLENGNHLVKIKTPNYLISKFLGRMNEGNYKFLFTNKEKFIKSKGVDEEFYPIIDFIYNNKDNFMNSTREDRVQLITQFINSSINVVEIEKDNKIENKIEKSIKKNKNLFK